MLTALGCLVIGGLLLQLARRQWIRLPGLPGAAKALGVPCMTAVVSVIAIQQSVVFYQAHTGWIDEIVYDARGGGTTRHLALATSSQNET